MTANTITYTVTSHDGANEQRGLTLDEAACEIMWYDGHEFEICPEDGGGYRLWTSDYSRNSPMGAKLSETVIDSGETDEAAATAEIYAKVLENAHWFKGQWVYTDAKYDAILAELEAEEADENDEG